MVASGSSYQGGPFVEAFASSGSNPLVNCKLSGEKGVQKVYEKAVKGYVYTLTGAASKLQLPKDERKAPLHFLQQFLVLQIFAPAGQHFALELGVTDSSGSKRKLYFSTAFHEVKTTPLHCQVPLAVLERDTWLNLAFDLVDLFGACFRGLTYRSLDVLVLGSVCRLRKIFTLRQQPIDSSDPSFTGEPLPSSLDYPTGVQFRTQVLNASRIRGGLAEAASAKRVSSEEPPAAKGATKRLSGSMHVAFGSRTVVPPPLVVVSSNVDLSQRGPMGGSGPVKKGEKCERALSSRRTSARERKEPVKSSLVAAEEEDAGEEWSPTERPSEVEPPELEAPIPKRKQPGKADKRKSGGAKVAATVTKAGKTGGEPGLKMKGSVRKVPARAESPVTAWGQGDGTDTPEETLLTSMSADWKRVSKGGEVFANQATPRAVDEAQNEPAESHRSSRGSRSVRFSEEGEALSSAQELVPEPVLAEPSENRASPGGRGLEARDVLAELERELAGLTAGTKNSPRAALWRSEMDGFSRRSSARGSPKTAGVSPLLGSGGGDESDAIHEEKLMAVAAMEEWEEDGTERAADGVNGALNGVNRADEVGLEADVGEDDDVIGRFGERGDVNEHFEDEAGVSDRIGDGDIHEHVQNQDGAKEHFEEEAGVNEHFEVHHEAAGSGRASEDTWRSRRSNSRYSQESDESDVTPRASPEALRRSSWDAQKGGRNNSRSPLSKEAGGSEGLFEEVRGSRNSKHGGRRESERNSRGSEGGPAETELGAEKRPPSIDWEAEDDLRSSRGSSEGSDWEASLSGERRSFRGHATRQGTGDSRLESAADDKADVSVTRGSSRGSNSDVPLKRVSGRSSARFSRDGLQASGRGSVPRGRKGGDVGGRTSEVETSLSEWTAAVDCDPSVSPLLVADVIVPAPANVRSRSRPASVAALSLTMRPEDMDLLFDPILKCFYDPKTNKYYDLKEEDDSLI